MMLGGRIVRFHNGANVLISTFQRGTKLLGDVFLYRRDEVGGRGSAVCENVVSG